MLVPRSRALATAISVLLLIAAVGSAAWTAPPRSSPLNSPLLPRVAAALRAGRSLRIIAFGSSSTQGVGATTPAASYPSQLQLDLGVALPRLAVAVANRGRGGEDVLDMMLRLPAVIAQHPDLVIWQTGTNDALRAVPLGEFIALTRAGIAAIRRAGSDVMLIEPQLCRAMQALPDSSAYRNAVRAIGAELGVPVIRRYELMQEWLSDGEVTRAQLLSRDGLHMADKGYALLAREVAREILRDAGAIRAAPAEVD